MESPHDLLGASIIGMLAYDTPFYSIHHGLVTDQAKYGIEKFQKVGQFCSLGASALMSTTATRAIESSKRTGSTKSWGLLAGAVGAVAVGAAAYMARDKISATLVDAYDEFTFIKDLTDMHGCDERYKKKGMGKLSMGLQHNRVKKLLQVKDIFFKCFYVMVWLCAIQRLYSTLCCSCLQKKMRMKNQRHLLDCHLMKIHMPLFLSYLQRLMSSRHILACLILQKEVTVINLVKTLSR